MSEIMDGMSMNIEQTEMDKLRSVFPQCFVENTLDIDKLLSLCGKYIDNDFEKYKRVSRNACVWRSSAPWGRCVLVRMRVLTLIPLKTFI